MDVSSLPTGAAPQSMDGRSVGRVNRRKLSNERFIYLAAAISLDVPPFALFVR